MTDTEQEFPRYFYKCNVCDSADHGREFYDYEIVDCPGCGSPNITRWEAKPNLSREWAYCTAFGHDWRTPIGVSNVERCACCGATRDFTRKK